jgi:hypothetical protein
MAGEKIERCAKFVVRETGISNQCRTRIQVQQRIARRVGNASFAG